MSFSPAARRWARASIHAWFVLDAIAALAPPLYWSANGRMEPIFGIPTALFYFLAVSACITASLVVAGLVDGLQTSGTIGTSPT